MAIRKELINEPCIRGHKYVNNGKVAEVIRVDIQPARYHVFYYIGNDMVVTGRMPDNNSIKEANSWAKEWVENDKLPLLGS